MALVFRLLAALLLCAVQVSSNKLRSGAKSKGAFEDMAASVLGVQEGVEDNHLELIHKHASLALEAKRQDRSGRQGEDATMAHLASMEDSIVALFRKNKASPAVLGVIEKIMNLLKDDMYPLIKNHSNHGSEELSDMWHHQYHCNDYLNKNLSEVEYGWITLWATGEYKPNWGMCEDDFNQAIYKAWTAQRDHVIVNRKCKDCDDKYKDIYLRLEGNPRLIFSKDPYRALLDTWTEKDAQNGVPSGFKTKFNLFSTWDDAEANRNAWQHCDGGEEDIGFPRSCGPTTLEQVPLQWTSFTKPGGRQDYMFRVYTAVFEAENPQRDELLPLAQDLQECVEACCRREALVEGYDKCGGYCGGEWTLTFTTSTTTQWVEEKTCEQKCPQTWNSIQTSEDACHDFMVVHSCTGINAGDAPNTEVCERDDFDNPGDYYAEMVSYWQRQMDNYNSMFAACEAAKQMCNAHQLSCPCEDDPCLCVPDPPPSPAPYSPPSPSPSPSPSPPPITCVGSDGDEVDVCSKFQRKIDNTACEQSLGRIDACYEYNKCWIHNQHEWNQTWWNHCSPPNGTRYKLQIQMYGLKRVECILEALKHPVSVRARQQVSDTGPSRTSLDTNLAGGCQNADVKECSYYYDSNLYICECPNQNFVDKFADQDKRGVQTFPVAASDYTCAVPCQASTKKVDESESPPYVLWQGSMQTPTSRWVADQVFESQLDGILECQAREPEFYDLKSVDIPSCEWPWPEYGPFTIENCSGVINADIDANTSGTQSYAATYYLGSKPVTSDGWNPAPCTSACCWADVDAPKNVTRADGETPIHFVPLSNVTEYNMLKALMLANKDFKTLYEAGNMAEVPGSPVRLDEFNFELAISAAWDVDGSVIIRRECINCIEAFQDIYLKVYKKNNWANAVPVNGRTLYGALLNQWSVPGFTGGNPAFSLFSNFRDALFDENKWQVCFGGGAGIGFPGSCKQSASQVVNSQQANSLQTTRNDVQLNYRFSVHQGIGNYGVTWKGYQTGFDGNKDAIVHINQAQRKILEQSKGGRLQEGN
eukprot:CAMPEP_0197643586 /NCGR_PEP_ID=MMETSP1338-20131121/16849_1 /TAXON_ID=43686 ORGANISM="Pelagodinium beii, Strain RCC1491" /NCGR_SAMPLE_ID=MMETSP1338 /ASSEMBLY_ACC=CAM_ASM_000754 /LENGTH=1041 /DNA_ID=CAMNT_0043216855 /DNA_START=106 /DNA_END=3231 /DNA_ORIENTATION=-